MHLQNTSTDYIYRLHLHNLQIEMEYSHLVTNYESNRRTGQTTADMQVDITVLSG